MVSVDNPPFVGMVFLEKLCTVFVTLGLMGSSDFDVMRTVSE
jgi:hypothetical protein